MLKFILATSLIVALAQAKAQRDEGLSLDSFFNESTLLEGVTYLSQDARHQDEIKLKFKTVQPYQPQWLRGEQVDIEFLNSQRYSNLKHIKMPQAYMQQSQDWLFSNQGCWFAGEQFQSFAQGAVMNLALERGLFLGKTKSYYYLSRDESNNTNVNNDNSQQLTKKTVKLAQSAQPTQPESANLNLPEDSTESANIDSKPQDIQVAREFLPDRYQGFLLEGQELNDDFMAQKEKTLQLFSKQEFDQIATVSQGETAQPEGKREKLIIENENGGFIDYKSGYTVYYGPVTVQHPEYLLECEGDLQIKLTQKKSESAAASSDNKKDDSGLEYAKAQGKATLIAWIEQDGEKKKVISKGDIIEIFVEDQIIKVQGGFPSLTQSGAKLQARDEGLSYQIDKAGSLITSKGSWKTEIEDLDQISN